MTDRRQFRREKEPLEATMTDREPKSVKTPTPAIVDRGQVRIGSLSPNLPPVRTAPASTADAGKVRIGSMAPSFPAVRTAPAAVADGGKVRIGSMSPAL
jgi:hypothetical protein